MNREVYHQYSYFAPNVETADGFASFLLRGEAKPARIVRTIAIRGGIPMTHVNRISNVISSLIVVLLVLLVLQSLMFRQTETQTVLLGVLAGLMAVIVMQSARFGSSNSIEYKTVAAGAVDESALEKFGKEGWKLICFDASGGRFIFSR